MHLKKAMKVLHIVKCDNLHYCRDLSYTPTNKEIGEAIETVEQVIEALGGDENVSILTGVQ